MKDHIDKSDHRGRRMFMKILLGTGAAIAASLVAGPSAVVYLEKRSYKKNIKYRLHTLANFDTSNILVVYFSRSGSTEIMAENIANNLKANLVRINAPSYKLSYLGWLNSMRDAYFKIASNIDPEKLDLSKYKLILLGSPIWLYRPAPPIKTFIKKNKFTENKVVLFNTYNSKFTDEAIQEMQDLVEKAGGKFTDHIHINRNRMLNQISVEELISRTKELVNKRKEFWL